MDLLAIERHIPLVTLVAETYPVEDTGETSRFEQEMSNLIFSRSVMPTYRSKKYYEAHHVRPEDDLAPPAKVRKLRSKK